MAGQVAMQLVESHPERVSALIINDTVPQAEDAAGRRRRHVAADGIVSGGMDAYGESALPKMIWEDNVQRLPEVAKTVLEMIQASPLEGATAAMRGRAVFLRLDLASVRTAKEGAEAFLRREDRLDVLGARPRAPRRAAADPRHSEQRGAAVEGVRARAGRDRRHDERQVRHRFPPLARRAHHGDAATSGTTSSP